MTSIDAPVTEHSTLSRDGTRVAWYRVGTGPRRWLIPPAMGAPVLSLKHILERFQHDYTMVTWDMRGFYGSGAPTNDDALRVDDHVADMEAVRTAAGFESFVVGGWSMGVQLSLEYYARAPERVRALVLINGPYGNPLRTALPIPNSESVGTSLALLGQRLGPWVNRASRALLTRPGMSSFALGTGLLAKNSPLFVQLMAEFSRIDWARYFRLITLLNEHSAEHVLPTIRVPTMITAGTHDRMTPPALAEHMRAVVPGAELFVIPRGTHYAPVEFPDMLNDAIARFLARADSHST